MMTYTPPKYGDPFMLSVTEGHNDGHISSDDLGLVYRPQSEKQLVRDVQSEVGDYGGGQQLYLCIPIGRVWSDTPHSDNDEEQEVYEVKTEIAESTIERMARAAIAMGVTYAEGAGS